MRHEEISPGVRSVLIGQRYLIFVPLIILLASGCNQFADEAACDRVYSHMVTLKSLGEPVIVQRVNADRAEGERFPFLEACVRKFTIKLTQCLLASANLTSMKKCNRE